MRRWSLKIGSVRGIGVYIHATFLMLIGYLIWANRSAAPADIALAILFVCAVFGCIVLHELGHAITAQRFGIQTRDITVLPIGGLARLERMPRDPRQELLIAIAGPAVNVVIAGLLFLMLAFIPHGAPAPDAEEAPAAALGLTGLHGWGFLLTLAYTNAALVVFNLLPAFPMDGGRILRAGLAYKLGYARATRIAAGVGQVMAGLFLVAGLMGNPMLVLIALFVFLGAQAEAQTEEVRWNINDLRVRDAMITDFLTLGIGSTLKDAADLLLAGSQQDFPVLDGERIAGVLARADLMRALATQGLSAPAAGVMRRDCAPVDESAPLPVVFDRMQQTTCPLVPVTRQGELVGMLTLENIGEFIMIRSALRGLPPPLRAEAVQEQVRRAG
jgi:Zn-dependent protease/CBS domain-containing protein